MVVPPLRHAWQQRCRDNLRQQHLGSCSGCHQVKLHVAIDVEQHECLAAFLQVRRP